MEDSYHLVIEKWRYDGFIDGEYPMPNQMNTKYGKNNVTNLENIAWRKLDRKVKAWITSCLSEEA